ncbi:hypothetical protein JXA88_18220 [Candidatus Fermentibacteria bacterium]|nr:hypothetical protein [Candidatus Fermentibacteria bacterium]
MSASSRVLLRVVCVAGICAAAGWCGETAVSSFPLPGGGAGVRVAHRHEEGVAVALSFPRIDWQDVQTPRGTMALIGMPGLSHTTRIGFPKLPASRRIIAVPFGATVEVEATAADTREFMLADMGIQYPLAPAQPPMPKNRSPGDMPFLFDTGAYGAGGFGESPLASAHELGILRGLRLFLLVVEPVRYDPVERKIMVYNDIKVEVRFNGGDRLETQSRRAASWSPYFEAHYRRNVLNYEPPALLSDLTRYPVKYAIVAHPLFQAQLQPFIQWKTMKGFEVVVAYVGDPDVGTTPASIKNYLQGLYDGATPTSPAPSFVLLVGDVAQVPPWQGTTGQHVTDLPYVTLEGADYVPDVYVGRFSANTSDELQPQIDKTLEYERFQMEDAAFLGETVMIAGMDPNFANIWANGQINYGTTYYFNEDHGILSHTYLYPASGSQAASIIADISRGVGYANYTAHGSDQGWGNPAFDVGDINGLQNAHRYPTVVGNCCETSRFEVQTCFAEAWLRAEAKGAVGYIGASNSSLWDEDFWWGVGAGTATQHPTYEGTGPGAYDGMFHDHGEPFPDWFTTQYAFIMAGCLAVVEAGSQAAAYYWEIYSLMGDPSLSTYFGVPSANPVGHPSQLTIGDMAMEVFAEPWSYAALSREGALLASALVGESGSATMTFPALALTRDLDLVVTRQNRIPASSRIQVAPGEGPWLVISGVQIDDTQGGNGDGQADFGEDLLLALTLRNSGTEGAHGVEALLWTMDPHVAIGDSLEFYGDILPGQEVTLPGAFLLSVAPEVPDNRELRMELALSDSAGRTWQDYFVLTAHAPVIQITGIEVNDSVGNADGVLDPGEGADIEITIGNDGGAGILDVVAVLVSLDPAVAVGESLQTTATLSPGAEFRAVYPVTASPTTLPGHSARFLLHITGTDYAACDSFTIMVGRVIEDFETGDFSLFPWVMDGHQPWRITSENAAQGSYGAVSGAIGNSQRSGMMVSLTVAEPGVVSFHYRVSSEASYDFLRFYVDGQQKLAASGNVPWTVASIAVAPGSHSFKWSYEKDQSVNQGQDRAWVDYIVFPALADSSVFPEIEVSPSGFDITLSAGQSVDGQLFVSNLGTADLIYAVHVAAAGGLAIRFPTKAAKGAPRPLATCPPPKGQGGPDGHGYRWTDSDSGEVFFEWIDIGGSGTCPGTDDDGNFGPFDLGFPFLFYGAERTAVRICSNGWLSFTSEATSFAHEDIPCPGEPNSLIAPLWTDLDPSSGGTIRYLSDPGAGRFIVQWDQVPSYSDTPDSSSYTFQAVLHADGQIRYHYLRLVGSVELCTVGTEDSSGMDGLRIAYNQPYLHDSLAVLIEPGEPWLRVEPTAGVIAPDSTNALVVTFTGAGLAGGFYEGTITVLSNDPDESSVAIPVALRIDPAAAGEARALPIRLSLEAAPNPFRGSCRFFGQGFVSPDAVRIYDIRGDLIWQWDEGTKPVRWTPEASVGSGVFVVRASFGEHVDSKRIVYLR